MKLKFEPVNGYGVLVDEKAEIKKGDWLLEKGLIINQFPNYLTDLSDCNKIIFAEKELGLDVPVFEWRDFEINELAEDETNIRILRHKTPSQISRQYYEGFIQGYKSNPAKFTEEDLRKAMDYVSQITNNRLKYIDDYVKSLQKYPKYVVMETEIVDFAAPDRIDYDYKLFTNSEGKQQGTVKELIWT
jgi:hypothetical protein